MRKNNQTGRILIKCGADKKVNNFLWRTAQMCRYFLSAMYKKHTQAKKYQADGLQFGRSMVEMLGVLAIIGVLSVGSIAGYQKAMMKYKLNKHAEGLNMLLSNVIQLSKQLPEDTGWNMYNHILDKLNLIPSGYKCINNLCTNKLEDIFGNQLYFYRTSSNSWGIAFEIKENKFSSEICQNIINIGKEHHYILYNLLKASGGQYEYEIYGDKYCTPDVKCLKDISITDIHHICTPNNSRDLYDFMIVWY